MIETTDTSSAIAQGDGLVNSHPSDTLSADALRSIIREMQAEAEPTQQDQTKEEEDGKPVEPEIPEWAGKLMQEIQALKSQQSAIIEQKNEAETKQKVEKALESHGVSKSFYQGKIQYKKIKSEDIEPLAKKLKEEQDALLKELATPLLNAYKTPLFSQSTQTSEKEPSEAVKAYFEQKAKKIQK